MDSWRRTTSTSRLRKESTEDAFHSPRRKFLERRDTKKALSHLLIFCLGLAKVFIVIFTCGKAHSTVRQKYLLGIPIPCDGDSTPVGLLLRHPWVGIWA